MDCICVDLQLAWVHIEMLQHVSQTVCRMCMHEMVQQLGVPYLHLLCIKSGLHNTIMPYLCEGRLSAANANPS